MNLFNISSFFADLKILQKLFVHILPVQSYFYIIQSKFKIHWKKVSYEKEYRNLDTRLLGWGSRFFACPHNLII